MSAYNQYYVKARANNMVRLVLATFETPPKVGDEFERDEFTGAKNWTIVRTFDFFQQQKLEALRLLMDKDGGLGSIEWMTNIDL